jgi:putative hydrolase of HD superfamily
MVDFLLTVGKLKTEKRTGWVNNKIPLAESIADHQYRMAIMGYFIRSPTRDPAVTATVALVHDIAEAIVGDITPPESSGVSVADKHRLEDQAMKTICGQLIGKNGENDIYNDMDQLYSQYNQQTSEEGKFCKQLDKLEMLIQAFEYETQHPEKDLSGFYKSADKGIHDPYLKQIQKEVLIRREVLKGKGLS